MAGFGADGLAIVIGANGGIGSALIEQLQTSSDFARVIGISRTSAPAIDLLDEMSIADAAQDIAAVQLPVRLVIVATGVLHAPAIAPEKSWRQLDASQLATVLAINTIGPALVAKHFLPLLPRQGKAVFAALSAKVGSIGDNRLGGWYGYRAAKAALNQMLHTAAIELARNRPEAICLALHPGTVATRLSAPFSGTGHEGDPPPIAAARLLAVIDQATAAQTGLFLDYTGTILPW